MANTNHGGQNNASRQQTEAQQTRNPNCAPVHPTQKPVEIKINETTVIDLEGEEEIDVEEEEEEEESGDERENEREILLDKLNSATRALKRGLEELDVIRSLKRSAERIDEEDDPDLVSDRERERGGTPPKRARLERTAGKIPARPAPVLAVASSPERLKKRSSEELADHPDEETASKRMKVGTATEANGGESGVSDGGQSPPPSVSVPSAGDPDPEEREAGHDVPTPTVPRIHGHGHAPPAHPTPYNVSQPRSLNSHSRTQTQGRTPDPPPAPPLLVVRESDLDQLYVFEAEVDA
jgi:hypothetical protein